MEHCQYNYYLEYVLQSLCPKNSHHSETLGRHRMVHNFFIFVHNLYVDGHERVHTLAINWQRTWLRLLRFVQGCILQEGMLLFTKRKGRGSTAVKWGSADLTARALTGCSFKTISWRRLSLRQGLSLAHPPRSLWPKCALTWKGHLYNTDFPFSPNVWLLTQY